jgi:hypothetical protein
MKQSKLYFLHCIIDVIYLVYSLSLFGPVDSSNTAINQTNTKQDKWPLIEYIQSLLEGKGADQKIEALRDAFSDYEPLFGSKNEDDLNQRQNVSHA